MSLASLKKFQQSLQRLPKTLGIRVAQRSSPRLTSESESTFKSSQDPYGAPWVPGADGKRVTLVKSGTMFRFLRYVAIGARLRVSLGVPYAKYQIGKRLVFPRQNSALPQTYLKVLTEETQAAGIEALQ